MSKKAVIFDFDCTLATVNVSTLSGKIKFHDQDRKSIFSVAMNRIFGNTTHLGQYKTGATKDLYDLPKENLLDYLRGRAFSYSKDGKLIPVLESDPSQQLPTYVIEEMVAEMLWGGQKRVNELRNLFDVLQGLGYSLMISSNGIIPQILMSLKVVDLLKYFDLIHVSNYGILSNGQLSFAGLKEPIYKLPMSKSDLIKTLVSYEGFEKIIYIDDLDKDMKNLFNPFTLTNPLTKKNIKDPYVSVKLCRCDIYYIHTLKPEGSGIGSYEIDVIKILAQH
jgi:FMN phosphatase YigB (HAD superfamily)